MKNIFALLLLAIGSFVIVSCGTDDTMEDDMHDHGHNHGDDTKYDATITINSPAEGAQVTVGEATHVDVDITRDDNKIIHNVKVEVADGDGNVLTTLTDDHVHTEGAYNFHKHDFMPEMHGPHKLIVTTSLDDGSEAITEEVSFMAMHGSSNSEYKVDIAMAKPAANTTAALNSEMEVEVTFTHQTAGELIHNVVIDVVDADGNQVFKIFEDHIHSDMPYTYSKADAWTPDTAGKFTIRAMTTDMNGENMNMMMHEVTVQ